MSRTTWATALPRPVAFVLSGGASLGAVQVGMLRALAEVGLEPDLIVGTSVGSLNGAVVAEHAVLSDAVDMLERTWHHITRRQVFPSGPLAQALSVLRTGHLHPQDGLVRLIDRTLRARTFAELSHPLIIVTVDVLTSHVRWHDRGDLVTALRAATAIPGVFPPVLIDGRHHWDAGSVANVPLQAALGQGAASLVVLDAGDVCHLDTPPRGIPDALLSAMMTAMRQRVLIEAPAIAERAPVLYLPRPCARNRSLLDLDTSAELIEPTYEVVADFLRDADPPRPGHLAGAPHHHQADLAAVASSGWSAGTTPLSPAPPQDR